MSRFVCDDTYLDDMKEYTGSVLEKHGVSSRSAEREIMILAESGNTVALKLYADMIFYKRVLRKNPYRDAFSLYLKSAGIRVDESGMWKASKRAYPPAYWMTAFCLVNYRRGSFLTGCEEIDTIEDMTVPERLSMAIELAATSLEHAQVPGAVNLIGRILYEASGSEKLYDELRDAIQEEIADRTFKEIPLKTGPCNSELTLRDAAEKFFMAAADNGYVYAANNLAVREADRISQMPDDVGVDEVAGAVERYIGYLKMSADRYEPYAANRLGLFYMTGEIKGKGGSSYHKEYTDTALAREYFNKATVCPDANSAWAFFNLIKYFHRDYDNDIEHMNEHMDYIKELNSHVYGLAMEL